MGLMAEMSLSELKERLEMEKRHAEQEREVQRWAILASKAEREGKVAEKAEQLAKIRKVAAAQAAARKAAAKTDKVEKAAAVRAVHEEATLAVDDKLRAKRDAIAKEK
jgi:YesN/AraC family two-component response regulator